MESLAACCAVPHENKARAKSKKLVWGSTPFLNRLGVDGGHFDCASWCSRVSVPWPAQITQELLLSDLVQLAELPSTERALHLLLVLRAPLLFGSGGCHHSRHQIFVCVLLLLLRGDAVAASSAAFPVVDAAAGSGVAAGS